MALVMEKHKMPEQDPQVRAHNFQEVALGYDEETAVAEAQRCLNCKVPKCREGCPVQVNIPAFIAKIKEKDLTVPLALSRSPAPCLQSAAVCAHRKTSVRSTALWVSRASLLLLAA